VKKFPAFIGNLMVHRHVHKSPPLDQTLTQSNPIYKVTPYIQVPF